MGTFRFTFNIKMEILTIDIEKIRKLSNGTIEDGETIRQIALYHLSNRGDNEIVNKINPKFYYYGLYPHLGSIGVIS